MAKAKEDVVIDELVQVEVPSVGDALAKAVAQGKVVSSDVATDLSDAKEVSDVGGTVVVKW